jgi:hypothetical protein
VELFVVSFDINGLVIKRTVLQKQYKQIGILYMFDVYCTNDIGNVVQSLYEMDRGNLYIESVIF